MRTLGKVFFKGLMTILPLALTIYILYWIGNIAESLFGRMLQALLPKPYYHTGMGLVLGIAVIFGLGVLMHFWVFRKVFAWGASLLDHIPLVKTLYGSIRDLLGYFGGDAAKQAHQVAMISLDGGKTSILGMVTRTDFDDLPDGVGSKEQVAVYVPMSYQVGGFTVMVPRAAIRYVDMSMQEAMRFAVTAGMSVQKPKPGEATAGGERTGLTPINADNGSQRGK